jgi:hypothetical protein
MTTPRMTWAMTSCRIFPITPERSLPRRGMQQWMSQREQYAPVLRPCLTPVQDWAADNARIA